MPVAEESGNLMSSHSGVAYSSLVLGEVFTWKLAAAKKPSGRATYSELTLDVTRVLIPRRRRRLLSLSSASVIKSGTFVERPDLCSAAMSAVCRVVYEVSDKGNHLFLFLFC